MITKNEILKKFQEEPEKYWKVSLFEEKGFVRKQCNLCKGFFWTLDQERKICADADCIGYQFIGQKNTNKKWDLFESWEEFKKFFEKNDHTHIPRYPVVSRWHPNLFFTIASIQDFQRFDDNNLSFEYPANPLIVPQISLRFNDIPNVGVTGRHMTCFQMSGQHAFNDESGRGYWKDKCIELNFEFLTKVMGIPEIEVVYKEDLWSMPDFSAFGPCIESFAKGLEIVNNVFMEFRLENSQIKELPLKVVDVGWGAERIPWYTQGTPTVYDVAYGNVIDKFKSKCEIEHDEEILIKYAKLAGFLDIDKGANINVIKKDIASKLGVSVEDMEKKIEPFIGMYSILDHTKTLAFAISDGSIVSNTGGGYNLRVILRRALSFIEKFKWSIKLEEVAIWHAEYLRKLFPELKEHEESIIKILQIEEKKYRQTRERTKKIIESFANREIKEEDLIKLYDSQGITPEQLGIETPSDFYQKVVERHMGQKTKEKKFQFDVSDLPATKILYYDEPEVLEFKAKILKVFDNYVVLDKTAFYPTQGGQLHDTGFLNDAKVIDVIKIGNVILHKIEGKLDSNEVVGKVDKERRDILRKHHDAIHIINGVVKRVIGPWCHQYGAEKDVDKARIDITHYEALSDDEIEKIEKEANEIAEKNLKITKTFVNRSEAEKKYGFDIYAGGYVPSKDVRIVSINNYDIEACGGTHGNSTGEVWPIIITRTKKIADGLVRIEIKASQVAIKHLQEKEKILKIVAEKLKVEEKDVPAAVEKLFNMWKKLKKSKAQ